MKRILLPLFIFCGMLGNAQVYYNEWIDYNKTYYKIKVGANKVYRIAQSTLEAAGLGSASAQHFQLWRNGQQVPLFISVASGALSASDYIEFWGEMNDGKPDKPLYRQPDYQLNDKWSLQTDSAAYFLTINPSGSNLRLVTTANSVAVNALAPEPYFMHTAGTYFRNKINPGNAISVGDLLYSSSYDMGEGYTSADLGMNGTITTTINNLFVYNLGPNATFRYNAAGNAVYLRKVGVRINGVLIDNLLQLDQFNYAKTSYPVPISVLSTNSASIEFDNLAIDAPDRLVVAQHELVYPRQFNFGGEQNFQFELAANADGNYLEISGFNYGSTAPVLYDLTNGKRYVADISAAPLVKIALQPSAVKRKLILMSQEASNISDVSSLATRTFVNYTSASNQGNYLIISNPYLYNGPGGSNPVEEYRAYRSSPAGGGHNAKVYEVDQLVDQFGFGIKKHPLALRNFILYARANFGIAPKFVFLLGKGVAYTQYRNSESHPDIEKLNLVPTFGQPASDNLLTSDPGSSQPRLAVGRLSAINGQEVAVYLKKVKDYEQAQAFSSPLIKDKSWMKSVAHIIGASESSLQSILETYMQKYKQMISDSIFGGNVYTFGKGPADAQQQFNSTKLEDLFARGISMITYFGHSSSSTLEFNLDNPDRYNNAGKYPVFFALGCNAGNLYTFNTIRFQTKQTLSEKFVLAPDRGSIAFIASSHFGIVTYLDMYNTKNYNVIGRTNYGKSLGENMMETVKQLFEVSPETDFFSRVHAEETILHGDPGIKVNTHAKPDYAVEDSLVNITSSFISVADTVIKVDAKFINLGKATNRNIVVEIRRQYPDLTTEVIYRGIMPGIRYADSISISVPIKPIRDAGLNKLLVKIDADNAVNELHETNNSITKVFIVSTDEVRPVYPYNFAIINKQNIKLVASTANPFSKMKQYMLEVDTTALFNSPFKITKTLNSKGGILEFNPGITFTDSTVYYWRVTGVPASGTPAWHTSASFVYLPDSDPGFSQSHLYQHLKSTGQRIYLDSSSRFWKYGNATHNLFLRMGTWITSGATQEASLTVSIDGAAAIRLNCWFSSLVFNVFDPITFKPWENQQVAAPVGGSFGEGLYGSTSNVCFGVTRRFNFEYRYTDVDSRRKMMDFMRDVIPDGAYVVVRNFTLDPAAFPGFPVAYASDWAADEAIHGPGQSLYHYLKNAGFAGIDEFSRPRPWGLVYKKNDAAFTPEWTIGDGVFDNPTLSVDCFTVDTIGLITSPVFGPAKDWKQLTWRGNTVDALPGDKPYVNVIGIKPDGSESVLFQGLNTTQQDFSISSINATQYPFVKLRMRNSDSVHYTPYQPRFWSVTYAPAPEGAVAPNIFFQMKDTLEVDEPLKFKMAFKNVSESAFSNLKVKMIVTNQNNVPVVIPIPMHRSLLQGDTLHINYVLNTGIFAGHNTLYVDVNPDNHQPEQFHYNNFIYRDFYVGAASAPLPLSWLEFKGRMVQNNGLLEWKTTNEINTSQYIIERSIDGRNYIPVGTIAASGNSTGVLTYQYTDPNITSLGVSIVYYRLKQRDVDGRFTYSRIIALAINSKIALVYLYPNPVKNEANLMISVFRDEILQWQIIDNTGRVIKHNSQQLSAGSTSIGIDVKGLANGVYYLRITGNSIQKQIQFVKE